MHGEIVPLWRCAHPEYDAFAEYLVLSKSLPSWAPWPLPPGWQITDFGAVGLEGVEPRATVVSCSGPSDLDGVVEFTVITEEPGVGLGSRVAGVVHVDPGVETGAGAPVARIKVDGAGVSLWAVSTSGGVGDGVLDRMVFAGEAQGRWIWVVMRPASAALMLQDMWSLQDISGLGPELVALPFGDVPRAW